MSSNNSEDMDDCAPEIIYLKEEANPNLLPDISREKYNQRYEAFIKWKNEKNENSINETVLLAYFKELSNKYKSSSLWSTYSMLKNTLNFYNNVNIEKYVELYAFLKRNEAGYVPTKAKTLSIEEINKFITEAHDFRHLAIKVALVMAVMGACRPTEMHNMDMKDIQDLGTSLLVTIPKSLNKPARNFKVSGHFYDICKKYIALRPKKKVTAFFLCYEFGKVGKQRMGTKKLASMPKFVATFLKLPEPEKFTGHCFKKSSAALFINGNIDSLACHGTWKSTVTEAESKSTVTEGESKSTMTEDEWKTTVTEEYTDKSIIIKEETPEVLNSIDPISNKTMEICPTTISYASPGTATFTNSTSNKDIHVKLDDGKNVLVFNISNSSNVNIFINKS